MTSQRASMSCNVSSRLPLVAASISAVSPSVEILAFLSSLSRMPCHEHTATAASIRAAASSSVSSLTSLPITARASIHVFVKSSSVVAYTSLSSLFVHAFSSPSAKLGSSHAALNLAMARDLRSATSITATLKCWSLLNHASSFSLNISRMSLQCCITTRRNVISRERACEVAGFTSRQSLSISRPTSMVTLLREADSRFRRFARSCSSVWLVRLTLGRTGRAMKARPSMTSRRGSPTSSTLDMGGSRTSASLAY
mmetsp:Transcript_4181/g.8447  ORF Transcript_4181/g.8447 Transcript_4181/m.8447 type:complete len:255 (-) Transcript_4181:1128-1892(-)